MAPNSAFRDFTGGIGSRPRPGKLVLAAMKSCMPPWNSMKFML